MSALREQARRIYAHEHKNHHRMLELFCESSDSHVSSSFGEKCDLPIHGASLLTGLICARIIRIPQGLEGGAKTACVLGKVPAAGMECL